MKAIRTKYHGPTNTRGSRVSATDQDGNRVTISYDHASRDPHVDACIALCAKMDWTGVLVRGSLKGGAVFVWLDDSEIMHADGSRLPVGRS